MFKKVNIMNFKDKLLSENYRDWLTNFVNKGTTYPQIIELDPTTNCMFSCPECISSDVLHGDTFSKEMLFNMITEFKQIGVKGIVFIGGGEPLLHPNFGGILKYVHECNIQAGITTNGLLIDQYSQEIAEYASWTRVSVDASNKDSFLKARPNRVPNSFNRIIQGMEKLSKIKNGLLGYCFLLMETRGFENASELYEAARIAKEIGCDYFEYKPLLYSNHVLYNFTDDFHKRVREEEEKLKELQTEDFRIVHPTSLRQYDKPKDLNQKKHYTECPVANFRTIVNPSGVYPCPYKRGHHHLNYGKVKDSFLDVWDSPTRVEINEKLDPSKHCMHYCIRNEVNEFLLEILKNPKRIKEVKLEKIDDIFV
ncbi:radical SAM/SPASM domain-containing protein [Schinkia sp. CFF1]